MMSSFPTMQLIESAQKMNSEILDSVKELVTVSFFSLSLCLLFHSSSNPAPVTSTSYIALPLPHIHYL